MAYSQKLLKIYGRTVKSNNTLGITFKKMMTKSLLLNETPAYKVFIAKNPKWIY